ncbi:phosphopantetheine-binding protein [Streptomyces sp. NPDC059578]|uniref:phosphopantetheine-binding protein n=1 Tax=unclassified Streptomyces TaxID=2593676 RepID=UPI003664FF2A
MAVPLTRTDFVGILRDEIGLDVTEVDLGRGLDELTGWDSVHLLALLILLEKEIGTPLSLPDFLDAGSLESIYELVTP